MKNLERGLVPAWICLFLAPAPAAAGELVGSANLSLYNSYYFRGAYVFENQPNLQPSVSVGWTDPAISLTVWSALPLIDRAQLQAVRDEVDVTVQYELPIGDQLSLAIGSILYVNPATSPLYHTEELYLAAKYSLGAGFAVRGGAYADVDALKGVYATAGAVWGGELIHKLRLEAGVMVSLTDYAESDFAFVESGGTAALSYALTEELSLIALGLLSYNASAEDERYAISAGAGWVW